MPFGCVLVTFTRYFVTVVVRLVGWLLVGYVICSPRLPFVYVPLVDCLIVVI